MRIARPAFYAIFLALAALSNPTRSINASIEMPTDVRFKKIILDRDFRSEGVAVADFNKDGKTDVIAGNLWYEAPDWTPREIQPVRQFDAAKGYSNSFVNFAADINRDGWPDQIPRGHARHSPGSLARKSQGQEFPLARTYDLPQCL